MKRFLRLTGLSAGGFLGLTALGAEGCGIAIGHACGVRVQRVQKVHRVQRVWYRPAGDEYKDSVTGFPFPPPTRHPERQRRMVGRPTKRKALLWAGLGPTLVDSRILCRMRAVRAAYETNAVKCRSAGRLPIGSQGSVEFLFWLAASYTLSRFAGLPLKGKQVVTYLTFICCRQHFGELAACGGFSPFGALRHHLSP